MPSVEPFLASRAQKAFIVTVTIQAIAVLAMVGIVFNKVDNAIPKFKDGYKTLPCYLSLFALAELFELVMAFDALRLRNVIQLAGIILFHFALIPMSALQVNQTKTALVKQSGCDGTTSYLQCDGAGTLWAAVLPFLIVAPCIIAASWLAIIFWIRQLYAEFGWAIFHVVGANPKMKTMYQYYQVMICLLKFDFFFFASVTMQLLIIVLSTSSTEYALTITAVPIVLILLVLCGIAVQREIKWIMTISLTLMLAAMSYFLYKLIRFYQPENRDVYATTRASLTLFTIVAFLILFCTFAVGLRCFTDFDRGLRTSKVNAVDKAQSRPKFGEHTSSMSQRQSSFMGGSQLTPRISIE